MGALDEPADAIAAIDAFESKSPEKCSANCSRPPSFKIEA